MPNIVHVYRIELWEYDEYRQRMYKKKAYWSSIKYSEQVNERVNCIQTVSVYSKYNSKRVHI